MNKDEKNLVFWDATLAVYLLLVKWPPSMPYYLLPDIGESSCI